MKRKVSAAWLGALAAAILTTAPNTGGAKEVVLATWGGTWGKAINDKGATPFKTNSGIAVKMISGVSSANTKMIAAQRDNPQVDVVMLTSQDAIRAYQDGLLEPLTENDVPSLKDFPAFGVPKDASGKVMFAGMWVYPYGLVYRTDKLKKDITCWKDLWDPGLKNKVAVSSPKYMSGYFLLMINHIAGGTPENVKPGIARIKQMGQNLLAVSDDSAGQQRLVAQGEVWASPMLSSSAYKMIEQGVPAKFIVPCEGTPAGMDVIALVKKAPHAADAKKFINAYLSGPIIAKVTEELKVTPVNEKAPISPEHAKFAMDKKKVVPFPDLAIVKHNASWQEIWDREISPMTKR